MSRLRFANFIFILSIVASSPIYADPTQTLSEVKTEGKGTAPLEIITSNISGLVIATGAFATLANWNGLAYLKHLENPTKDCMFEYLISGIYRDFAKSGATWELEHTFLVQSQYTGQRYGVVRRNWFKGDFKDSGLMFVTEPISTFKDRVLVVFTHEGPECTYIFVVDKKCNSILVYDSFDTTPSKQTQYAVTKKDTPDDQLSLSRVYEIVYKSPGKYILVQYRDRGEDYKSFIEETELTAIGDGITLRPMRKVEWKGRNRK